MRKKWALYFLLILLAPLPGNSQVLTLKNAVATALDNYGIIKAKANYLKASEALVKTSSLQYLPDFNLGAENVYGTANGTFGPLYPGKVQGAASAGPFFLNQNWHSAFGALYLANVNWDVFTFGRVSSSIKLAKAQALRDTQDLEQENFQQRCVLRVPI